MLLRGLQTRHEDSRCRMAFSRGTSATKSQAPVRHESAGDGRACCNPDMRQQNKCRTGLCGTTSRPGPARPQHWCAACVQCAHAVRQRGRPREFFYPLKRKPTNRHSVTGGNGATPSRTPSRNFSRRRRRRRSLFVFSGYYRGTQGGFRLGKAGRCRSGFYARGGWATAIGGRPPAVTKPTDICSPNFVKFLQCGKC